MPPKLPRGTPTGFFHVQRLHNAWWFIDPTGKPFFALGTNRVDYLNTPDRDGVHQYHHNIKSRFPTEAAWSVHIAKRLRAWGFNTMGLRAGSKIKAFRAWPHYAWCPASHPFAAKKARLTAPGVPGYMTFVDIFDPAFARLYDRNCRQLAAPQRRDPNLLGYYTDNELFWGVTDGPGQSLLDAVLFQSPATFNKRELVRFLRDRYNNDLASLNANWQLHLPSWRALLQLRTLPTLSDPIIADKRAFLYHYARHYFKTVSTILRKHDPNHLILGCRIHGWSEPEVAHAMGEFIDVVSFNKYDNDAPSWHMAELFGREANLPTLVSEWGFRAMDAGLPNTGGVGRITADQSTRGQKYAHFLEGLARSPWCVGSIFYAYVDDPATGGGGIMKNENSNYGIVNIHDQPYAPFVRHLLPAHRQVLAQHLQGELPTRTISIATPRDFHREPISRFFIQTNGLVTNHRYLRAFIQGPDAGRDSQPTTFDFDFPTPIHFIVKVYETENTPTLQFVLDGRLIKSVPLHAGPRKGKVSYAMPQGHHTIWDRPLTLRIPKGPHTLTLQCPTPGWLWLDGYEIHP